MSITAKLKSSVESATGLSLYYYDEGGINALLDNASLPCAFYYLIRDTELIRDGSQIRERASIAVYFVDKTEFDFKSDDNEAIIESLKTKGNSWLTSLVSDSTLTIDGTVRTTRIYNEFDVILTGIGYNLTIEENYGFNVCKEQEYTPTHVRRLEHNGLFEVHEYDWVEVDLDYHWGEIDGNINDQTDLRDALDLKADLTDVHNGTLTIKKGAETIGTFTANQSGDTEVTIPDTDLSDVERTTNKVTDLSSADNTKYPTALAVLTAINAIENVSDIVDIVATKADLDLYDTTHLGDKDIVKVIADETHDGKPSYWRWDNPNRTWGYVASENGGGAWGQISGDIEDQTDLMEMLQDKQIYEISASEIHDMVQRIINE